MKAWKPGVRKARVLNRRTILRSQYFHVVEEEVVYHGRRFIYQFRPHGGVVHMVALTPQGRTVMVRQYRHPVRKSLLELPAGKMNRRESALAAAKRELVEETGYVARRWIRLGGWYPSPASSNMITHYFLALDARRARTASPEAFEFLRVEHVPFARLLRRFAGHRDVTVNTLLGIALAARYLKER